MAGLHVSRPFGIVRAAPAILVVLPVPQRVKRLLPARCRDIQALAGLKIHSCRQDVHVDPAVRFSVLDSRPGVAVRFQPRPGGFLELVHHTVYLRIARGILRRPGDHARGVLVLELKRIDHGGHLVRIAAQNFHFFWVLFLVLRGESLASEIVRRLRRRSGAVRTQLILLSRFRLLFLENRFYPKSLERGCRSEKALKLAIAEMYVMGVSTRKVTEITEQLCGLEISATQVSRVAGMLDEELEEFRSRELGEYPIVYLDAHYEKVRRGGRVQAWPS